MEEDVIELTETQASYHGHLDDGRDWTSWHVWNILNKYRIRAKIIEPPPTRPQVVPPQQPPKKSRLKTGAKKSRGKHAR